MLWALAHSPLRGVWGHAPPEKFGNLDSLRAILRHSDSDLNFIVKADSYLLYTGYAIYFTSGVRYLETILCFCLAVQRSM
jgi:hypothetical protein